jgi:hypothetical protein
MAIRGTAHDSLKKMASFRSVVAYVWSKSWGQRIDGGALRSRVVRYGEERMMKIQRSVMAGAEVIVGYHLAFPLLLQFMLCIVLGPRRTDENYSVKGKERID